MSTPGGDKDVLPDRPGKILHWSVLEAQDVWIGVVVLLAVIAGAALIWSFTSGPECEACDDPVDRVAIGKNADGETMTIRFVPCGNEPVARVAIRDRQRGSVLWEGVAPEPSRQTVFIVGQLDEPFEETVAIPETLPPGDLEVILEADRDHEVEFTRLDLLSGFVFWDGFNWTADEFEDQVRAAGACEAWIPRLGNSAAGALRIAIIVLAIAVAGLFASRIGTTTE